MDRRYLLIPVTPGATKRVMTLTSGGRIRRQFTLDLAEGTPAFHVFLEAHDLAGADLQIDCDPPATPMMLEALTTSDDLPDKDALYREPRRPQFHFTSRRGWLNDPNGLVYTNGEWHLFYQHNPFGVRWGNMHWGHAVSNDLLHWRELGIAIYPQQFKDWAYSGCAVMDHANTSGFGTPDNPPMVVLYTSTGRGECLAYSLDHGRTLTEFAGNPVLTHAEDGRDPKLLWHAPTRQWVMAVYDILDRVPGVRGNGRRTIAFHTSPDLKTWTYRSRIEGYHECPDLFELPVEGGSAGQTRWVLYGADAEYQTGDFDGATFTPDGPKRKVWHGRFYAAQSFDNAPDGRRVQIGWANKLCRCLHLAVLRCAR